MFYVFGMTQTPEELYLQGANAYNNGDYKTAVNYLSKASEQNHAGAQRVLGSCYLNGYGVEKNISKAKEWFKKTKDNGDVYAAEKYSNIIEEISIPQNTSNFTSPNNTTSSSTSTSNNTSSNVTSNNNSQNASLLYQRYRKAAEQGNAEAQYRLGECYEYGYGVSIDYNKALIWYNKAIKLGNKNAENAYENCFIKGALDYIKTYQYIFPKTKTTFF